MTFLEMAENPHLLTVAKLSEVRAKLELTIKQGRSIDSARRLLDGVIAAEERRPHDSALHITGALAWDKHASAVSRFRGFHGEDLVAYVDRRAHHTEKDKSVFTVWIGEKQIAEGIHRYQDAIAAGEAAWKVA